jgi:hypothetical protein
MRCGFEIEPGSAIARLGFGPSDPIPLGIPSSREDGPVVCGDSALERFKDRKRLARTQRGTFSVGKKFALSKEYSTAS